MSLQLQNVQRKKERPPAVTDDRTPPKNGVLPKEVYHMRKHQRRNNYDQERASAAAVRKAQAQPRPRKGKAVPSPERMALDVCAAAIRKIRLSGERIPAELNEQYSTLLKQYHATL
jgi:hypothetical protein